MPKIMQNSAQMKALEAVSSAIESIETINKMMAAFNGPGYNVSISVKKDGSNAGRPISMQLTTDKQLEKAKQMLLAQKASLAKTVQGLAAKFKIELSEDELNAMQSDG